MTIAAEHTIGRWLTDRARTDPERIAIDDRGVAITYRHLCERAEALAGRLTDAGYGPGLRIATVSGNSTEHVIAFFACMLAGIAFVPLSWRSTPEELARLVERTDAAVLLVDAEHAALAAAAAECVVDMPPSVPLGSAGVEIAVPVATTPVPARAVRDDDAALIIYTSGSQAAPKGVILTHANCFWNNLALSHAMPIGRDDVVLSILPQFHAAGWNVQPLLAWRSGATVVLERSFQPERVLQLLHDRGITTMMGVPTQYRMLADAAGFADTDLRQLRCALVGGATMPPSLADRWTSRGVHIVQGYGLTEAGPNVLSLSPEERRSHPGAVGRPYPHVDVQIVDPETELPLAGAATGELWVRGPSVFAGYWRDNEATQQAMCGEWLRTGDVVQSSPDGVITIIDRRKEIFISGGENVAPAEVEAALAQHPLVRDVAVVAIPDDVWGERGAAFVVANGSLSTDELLTFARQRLAAYKLPVFIDFVAELPRKTLDKVDRAQLRQRAAQLRKGRVDDHA